LSLRTRVIIRTMTRITLIMGRVMTTPEERKVSVLRNVLWCMLITNRGWRRRGIRGLDPSLISRPSRYTSGEATYLLSTSSAVAWSSLCAARWHHDLAEGPCIYICFCTMFSYVRYDSLSPCVCTVELWISLPGSGGLDQLGPLAKSETRTMSEMEFPKPKIRASATSVNVSLLDNHVRVVGRSFNLPSPGRS
jgi:hypothetical protein